MFFYACSGRVKCFAGLQRMYIWTCRSGVDSRRMLSSIEMWEARNMFRHTFMVCLSVPCGTESEGFLGLCRHCFDTTAQKGWVCCVCLCVCSYTSCARAYRHYLLNPAMNNEIVWGFSAVPQKGIATPVTFLSLPGRNCEQHPVQCSVIRITCWYCLNSFLSFFFFSFLAYVSYSF